MERLLFYLFSSLSILSALMVVLLPRPTRALLALMATMFSLSALYLLLGAPFIAMVHLIVYAGAVLVLFLFVIMLQGVGTNDIPLSKRFNKYYLFLVCFVGAAFLAALLGLITAQALPLPQSIAGTVEAVGNKLFRDYLLPFELISVLLLVGIFAAISLAKKEEA